MTTQRKPSREATAIALVERAILAGHVVATHGPDGEYTVGPYHKAVGPATFGLFGYGRRVLDPYRAREGSAAEMARMFVASCVGSTRAREAAQAVLRRAERARRATRMPMRRRASAAREAHRRPSWTVIEADRDGRPVERVWRLPRLGSWAGYAVFDFCTRGRGRYELMRRIAGTEHRRRRGDESYEASGLRFDTLAQLEAHLEQHAPRAAEIVRRGAVAMTGLGSAIDAAGVTARMRLLQIGLERAGWQVLAVEIDISRETARIELRRGDLQVTFDARNGRASTTRERVRRETVLVGRRGDRFRAERIAMEFVGRTRHEDARSGLHWLAQYVADNGDHRLGAADVLALLGGAP